MLPGSVNQDRGLPSSVGASRQRSVARKGSTLRFGSSIADCDGEPFTSVNAATAVEGDGGHVDDEAATCFPGRWLPARLPVALSIASSSSTCHDISLPSEDRTLTEERNDLEGSSSVLPGASPPRMVRSASEPNSIASHAASRSSHHNLLSGAATHSSRIQRSSTSTQQMPFMKRASVHRGGV
mmetsp:Transcript_6863/g.12459  ORF Transcript_6863/g.12459 Transcript_6863/m.12459 type:complete len:183 (+) Transcript_6863:1315-1863(+)